MSLLESFIDNEYLRFIIIIIGTIILSAISFFILKIIATRIAGRKKTYGEFIIKQLSKPIIFLLILIGFYHIIILLI